MIVVDLGCFPHRHEISIEPLVRRYHPEVLYGFDPWPKLVEGERIFEGTKVVLERKAAWIYDGTLELARVRGLRAWDSTVMRDKNARREWSDGRRREVIEVACFDVSAWLRTLPEPAIVKMDVEGAEFPILERVCDDGTDASIAELLVEWHDDRMPGYEVRKQALLRRLRCPVRDWEQAGRWDALVGLRRGKRALGAR